MCEFKKSFYTDRVQEMKQKYDTSMSTYNKQKQDEEYSKEILEELNKSIVKDAKAKKQLNSKKLRKPAKNQINKRVY